MVLVGWRSATVDIDVRFDPEAPEIFEAIMKIEQDLNINIELASPQDFLPRLPGWKSRNVFIGSIRKAIALSLRFHGSGFIEAIARGLNVIRVMFRRCMRRGSFR